jgi:manganese/zinc/iron transport system permease protein
MNPYRGTTFISFFGQLFHRLWLLITGHPLDLAPDELQLLVLCTVAVSAAFVGAFLVLRRMTMMANAVSHTILLGVAAAFLLTKELNVSAMLFAALVTGLGTALLTEFLSKHAKVQEDASMGLVFTALFALGVVLVTLYTRNTHLGAEVVMGNVDALQFSDLQLAAVVLLFNLALFGLFFKEYRATTFDPQMARSMGLSPLFFNYLLMTQASGTVVGAFRAVGVVMVLALLVAPVVTARLLTHRLSVLVWLASAIGCMAALIGVAFSRHLLTVYRTSVSTGGLVVCALLLIFLLVLLQRFVKLTFRRTAVQL